MFEVGGDTPSSPRQKNRPAKKSRRKKSQPKNLLTITFIFAILYLETKGAKNDFEMDNKHQVHMC